MVLPHARVVTVTVLPVIMEAAYLKRTVGTCLADGLAELSIKRPDDPIEYLALWMLKYKQNTLQRERDGVRTEHTLNIS